MELCVIDTSYANTSVKVIGLEEKQIRIGHFNHVVTKDDRFDIPRWMGLVLEVCRIVQIDDSQKITDLKQALVKENVKEGFELATLSKFFYMEVWQEIHRMSKRDHDKILPLLNTLVRKRTGKIIQLSSVGPLPSEIINNLTIEESELANILDQASTNFKHKVLRKEK